MTQLTLLDENNDEYDGKAFTLPHKGAVTFTAEFTIPGTIRKWIRIR